MGTIWFKLFLFTFTLLCAFDSVHNSGVGPEYHSCVSVTASARLTPASCSSSGQTQSGFKALCGPIPSWCALGPIPLHLVQCSDQTLLLSEAILATPLLHQHPLYNLYIPYWYLKLFCLLICLSVYCVFHLHLFYHCVSSIEKIFFIFIITGI